MRRHPHKLRNSAASIALAQGVALQVDCRGARAFLDPDHADVSGHLLDPQRSYQATCSFEQLALNAPLDHVKSREGGPDAGDLLLLSVTKAVERQRIPRAHADRLVPAGSLPSIKFGRLRKNRPADRAAYVASLELAGDATDHPTARPEW